MRKTLILVLISVTLACTASDNHPSEAQKPTNIILLIGDGMGLSEVTTGFYYGPQPSVFTRFREIGLQQTSSAKQKVTDSAASGTALATGTLTYNGAIGVDTARATLQNITEFLSSMGWSTGVVATSTISHATPASFYAHVEQRMMEEEIASQLLLSNIDFFAGGGRDRFNKRRDGKDLLLLAPNQGYSIDTTGLAVPGTLHGDQKYGFLLAGGNMPSITEGRGDFLPEATALAISHLSQNQSGFFLMVEGSQIDYAGHANDAEALIGEVLDFEKAIAVALDFAEKHGNTLVVVTADHETGGFALGPELRERQPRPQAPQGQAPQGQAPQGQAPQVQRPSTYPDYSTIQPVFATGQHTATLIPVFAYGPGAERFRGIYKNTAIHDQMKALVLGEQE